MFSTATCRWFLDANRRISEALLRERPAGGCLQITLEFRSAISISKGYCSLDFPWAEPRGVRNFSSIMLLQASFQIVGAARVKMPSINLALENINVRECH